MSFGVTDKVWAVGCCLYQLSPHCVWLLRRWAVQRCPPGLERRRTGWGAWRDKNLISLQPFVVPPPPHPTSSHPRGTTEWYYRYTATKRNKMELSCFCTAEEDESFVSVSSHLASPYRTYRSFFGTNWRLSKHIILWADMRFWLSAHTHSDSQVQQVQLVYFWKENTWPLLTECVCVCVGAERWLLLL